MQSAIPFIIVSIVVMAVPAMLVFTVILMTRHGAPRQKSKNNHSALVKANKSPRLTSWNSANCPYCHERILFKSLKRAKGEFFTSFAPKLLCPNCENPVKLSVQGSLWVVVGLFASTVFGLLARHTSIVIPLYFMLPVVLVFAVGIFRSASRGTLEKG